MEAVHEDGGEGGMQCARHPFRHSSPSGGICASCLQEKLGKLVSSSYAVAVFPSSSASSSPSSRSAAAAAADSSSGSSRKLPFASKKKCKEERSSEMVFKRSKSTATPRRGGLHFFDQDYKTPTKRRFWKFLHYSKHPTSRKADKHVKNLNFSSPTTEGERKRDEFVAVDDNETTFDRKVSRSRSVGCGSRSFSGDFFERISTGFGDCTLRRVESQREGKPKMKQSDCSRQRARCGGIFGGFGLTSSSSSSHLIAASDRGGKSMVGLGHLSHGRTKSWGWALASPMRAFGKSSAVKRGDVSAKNAAPNLAAIPSLLAVGG
ncbi:uncharacterized protein LOC125203707 [Salvia hispanica]|uniref:uncharacterized protein LOC125203707 n=1 Tax=Salvia hispanica TaxID=49212 RepID=UPI00200951F9|nr:uncharacterized protein LOC125203707 [Salvia hispanica]